jgi:hypothetical protein
MTIVVTRKLVAVFAADVEGYSRLMGSDEAGTLKRLRPASPFVAALLAAISILVVSTGTCSASKRAGAWMKGYDTNYGSTGRCSGGTCNVKTTPKTCTGMGNVCTKRNGPSSATRCAQAVVSCMQTGVFVGPQGAVVNDLAKR